MISSPLITVGSLCYNNGLEVVKTLAIIKNQTYKNIDHIIIDDCSEDGSGDLIENWIKDNNYKCRFIRNERNIGICKTLNKILSLAEGEYWTANSDDFWEPFHLEKSLELLKVSGADVIYSTTRICKPDGMFLHTMEDGLKKNNYPRYNELFYSADPYFIFSNDIAVDALFYFNYLHLISFLLPIHLLKSIGGYNEKLPFEDYDLNFKICRKYKICFNQSFSAIYYKHNNSYTVAVSRIASLYWGIALSLANNFDAIVYSDTKKKVQQTIRYSAAVQLKANPFKCKEVYNLLNIVEPGKKFRNLIYITRVQLGNAKSALVKKVSKISFSKRKL